MQAMFRPGAFQLKKLLSISCCKNTDILVTYDVQLVLMAWSACRQAAGLWSMQSALQSYVF